jgi:hypothetical protein
VALVLASVIEKNIHDRPIVKEMFMIQSGDFLWSLLVLAWGVAVLVLVGRCSYYLKHLLAEIKARAKSNPTMG